MKQLKHFALCALLMPAVTFSLGAVAQDDARQDRQDDAERTDTMTDDNGRTEGATGNGERNGDRNGNGERWDDENGEGERIDGTPGDDVGTGQGAGTGAGQGAMNGGGAGQGGMNGDGGGPGGDAEGATGDHGRTDRTTGDGQRWDDTDDEGAQAGQQGGMGGAEGEAEYLSVKPQNAVRVDEVIGGSLHMRDDDEEVGNINDLLIDETGQVVAVIVDVGGFLGIGQRSVAVSWDSVEQTQDEDGDFRFTLNATEDTLRDAPSFDDDDEGIRNER